LEHGERCPGTPVAPARFSRADIKKSPRGEERLMSIRRILLAAIVASLALGAQAQTYTVTDLGTLGGPFSQANAIGGWGQIVGASQPDAESGYHAFLYSGRTMQDLGAFGGEDSVALAINANSQIAGYFHDGKDYKAFLWTDGQLTELGNLGKAFTAAYGLNNKGDVVGFSRTSKKREHAFLYTEGRMIDLGTLGGTTSAARGVNDNAQVTGYAYNEQGDFLAFLWQNGNMTSLGTLGGDWSMGNAINNAGQVVGQAYLEGNDKAHAFLYDNGRMTDLGDIGGNYSNAVALNSTGTQIVGYASDNGKTGVWLYSAVVYRDGKMMDLNQLIPRGTGWFLRFATGVDDTGQIVGYGTLHGEDHAFLLTPQE
jgi:probable HAF family extracellular repeat protein